MTLRHSVLACACATAVAAGALAAPAGAAELSSDQTTTTMSEEKVRLALTFGETSAEEAEACSTSMGRGPGMTPKDVSLRSCSPEVITADEAREAWAGSSQHLSLLPGALLERLQNIVVSLWELLSMASGQLGRGLVSFS
ncbi:hypothetical protein C1Y63_11490 [Corynebacterium sp. 13CS0277]|uniref:hypothetical protein n=1 Tax=Corynebacterium sp. 13CS0277 TaxID=2071994 RepID=UPI000D02D9D7|nr:hypothetical protein [Corynebacterium sp. 13CS0277]PRQ10419.1 hypothetical protein C1Y63_11490 [Corynebacterium sp. 13CS0277]